MTKHVEKMWAGLPYPTLSAERNEGTPPTSDDARSSPGAKPCTWRAGNRSALRVV